MCSRSARDAAWHWGSSDLESAAMPTAHTSPTPTEMKHQTRTRSRRSSKSSRRSASRAQRVPDFSVAQWCCAAILATSLPMATAQNSGCISLANSRTCGGFNASSVSTDAFVSGLFPFLASVNSVETFDSALTSYIASGYTQTKYQNLIGCSNLQLSNTTDYYARYTTSVLCNAIIQNSITPCGLTGAATRPLCADACADYAISEQRIVASNVCGTAGANALTQVRADFTNCALPANALTGTCVEAVANQPDNCGFETNLGGLCSYCAASSPNATDSCCVFSKTTTRCQGVVLPIVASASLGPVTVTMTASGATTTATVAPYGAASSNGNPGLTRGQIAGIAIGSILGAFFLLFLVIAGCLLLKRRRDHSPHTSIFNQPASGRVASQMSYNDGAHDGLGVLAGGRVARMSALEGGAGQHSPEHDEHGPEPYTLGAYAKDFSDDEEDSPGRQRQHLGVASMQGQPPKRSGSLSGSSHFDALESSRGSHEVSPISASASHPTGSTSDRSPIGGAYYGSSSPESRNDSQQLDFFKDYYSNDSIHRGDLVSTLWSYEPRANDEFPLERGDMIKVVGIWDDGWATGVRQSGKAEDWRSDGSVQRDSGLSEARPNVSSIFKEGRPGTGEAEGGDVKAFPLVCVCLPQHWRKTIDGDSTGMEGMTGHIGGYAGQY